MESLTGKELELRQRDELFLAIARQLFLEKGFRGVTMGKIAQKTGFSKGTLYLRFGSREALLTELGLRYRDELIRLLEYANTFEGRPRERILALGESVAHYMQFHADNMRILVAVDDLTVREKVQENQHNRLMELANRTFSIIKETVQAAIDCGDLHITEPETLQTLCCALRALIDGWGYDVRGILPPGEIGISDSLNALVRSAQALMDGFGWKPLYHEWDYSATRQRILTYLSQFPETTESRPAVRTGTGEIRELFLYPEEGTQEAKEVILEERKAE